MIMQLWSNLLFYIGLLFVGWRCNRIEKKLENLTKAVLLLNERTP